VSSTPDHTEIPEALIERRRRRSSQLIWIVPIIAAVIGVSLAIKSYIERGPVISITFKNGEGIEAGKTRIKYKDVQIGEVKSIKIARDRSHVVVTAEINREAGDLLKEDTRFWVVRARISGNSVSGLSTLMEGSYIGVEAGLSKEHNYEFTGLDRPPVVNLKVPGRQYILHASDIGSLDISSPIYYRRMQVGEVIAYDLDKDGKGVTIKIFVQAPYDRFVKANTRFWHASGVDFTLDANGVKLNTESMVSILLGGIACQTPEDRIGTQPAAAHSAFTLFADRETAMKNPDTVVETYVMMFRESVRGLPIGAPVDLRGVAVGEVNKISVEMDTNKKTFSMPVEVRFYPERLRARYRDRSRQGNSMDSRKLLDTLVENGLRAQIRSANLLTGQLYVALDFFAKAPHVKIDWSKNPPEIPTMTGSIEEFQATLIQILQKLDKLPLEDLAGDARRTIQTLETTLKGVDKLLKNLDTVFLPESRAMVEDVRKTLDEARKTLAGAKQTLSADAPLQQDLRETLRELGRAAQSLRALSDYLERHPESLIRGKKEDEK
jgi:paraquat-inducible protein B